MKMMFPGTPRLHSGDDLAGAEQRTVGVHAPSLFELFRRDRFDISEHPRSGVIKQSVDLAELAPDRRECSLDRGSVAHVAWVAASTGDFALKSRECVAATREERHRITRLDKTSGERRPVTWACTCHDGHRLPVLHALTTCTSGERPSGSYAVDRAEATAHVGSSRTRRAVRK